MTGVSTLGSALNRISLLNQQNELLNTLSVQLTTGKRTQTFSGLDTQGLTSQRARASFQSLDTYLNNITNADRRISLTLDSIEEFQAQAENFSNALVQFSQQSVHQQGDIVVFDDPFTSTVETTQIGVTSAEPDVDLKILRELAGNIFSFLGDLLNSRETDRFLLGGADTRTKPYNNNGTLDAALSTLISNWKNETLPPGTNINNTELVSALRSRTSAQDPNAITDSIIGFSPALSADNVGDVFVRVDERTEIKYTALANEDPFRDILVAAAFINNENLTPIADVFAQPYTLGDPALADGAPGATLQEQKDNFFDVFNQISTLVSRALDDLDGVRFRLEGARARIDQIRERHEINQNVLLNTIGDVEDVDFNDVAIRINSLQLQLDASYRVTASIQQLSLVNFL